MEDSQKWNGEQQVVGVALKLFRGYFLPISVCTVDQNREHN
jgi:hypothetical protein